MVIDHNFYMSLAIKEAWKKQGLTYPNPAVGAVVLDKMGKLLSVEATQPAGKEHAELKAIESALIKLGDKTIASLQSVHEKYQYILENHNNALVDATIYVTLEPCTHHGKTPPCAPLVKTCGFKTLVCGTIDPNQEATGGLNALQDANLDVITGILQKECDLLLIPFRKNAENKPFIFFKLALYSNGVYDGGLITSKESRTLVHEMRSNIDLLVIGGNTVREDRPTLDSRLVSGKAPDVLIISQQKEFDKDIPLFSVPNRQVFIEDNFDRINQYRFIMIEGTQTMLQLSHNLIDLYCIFTSSSYKKGNSIQLDKNLKRLQLIENEEDTITWLQNKG